ncbi:MULTISPECIES: hypothetical protein [Parachlamydia]|uniref:hypothetical protein n=1 Tax=Parachlamydia TaxID=83551 RepID=UPI0024E1A8D6|nr:hypothetical protein [Parachlamydia acanthamoebae]
MNTHEKIQSIPFEDRVALEELFSSFIFEDTFGYTLFGNKPISLGGNFRVTPWANVLAGCRCGGAFWKKWEIWEKYQDQFLSSKYLLISEPHFLGKSDLDELILLINKRAFLKSLENHLITFENILKQKIIPEEFLGEIENGTLSFFDSIQKNETLLGILLGYGKHNAEMFYQRKKIFKFDCLTFFGDHYYSPLVVNDVFFVADQNHPETKYLRSKYTQLRGKISEIYAKGDLLTITLGQFVAD